MIRALAPDPSTLRDVGTLLLVLWLPAVGNLVAFLLRKLPRRKVSLPAFGDGAAFRAHLEVQLEPAGPSGDADAAMRAAAQRCTLLVGPQGFTARIGEVPSAGGAAVPVELLRPSAALPHLKAGVEFHLVVGNTGVAKGRVLRVMSPEPT